MTMFDSDFLAVVLMAGAILVLVAGLLFISAGGRDRRL
jgi:hypothetical protein